MIGKLKTGKSFRGCLNYLFEGRLQKNRETQKLEQDKKQAEVICYNQCFGNKKELIQQFNEVRYLNPKLSKPVFHASLSFSLTDQLSNQAKADIVREMAAHFGFENNQYIAIEHFDVGCHLHVAINRIGFDNKTVSDSNSYRKIADFCRKMELKYNLQQVLSPRKFLPPEQRVIPRKDNRKEFLKEVVAKCLGNAGNMEEFRRKLNQAGYQVEVGRGIAFTDTQMVRFKGSQINYPLHKIQKQIERNRTSLWLSATNNTQLPKPDNMPFNNENGINI